MLPKCLMNVCQKKSSMENYKKGKRKVQGVPQSQAAALTQEEEGTVKTKQAQIAQTYEKLENAAMVVSRSDARTPSNLPLKTSIYQQSRGNRFHRIEQSDKAS